MRIAACADLHLDRIPACLEGTSVASGHYVWDRVVDFVISGKFDVLLLSGDVMDSEKSWFACYGPLISGLSRLKDADVCVIGVSGNHDYSAFAQIARHDSDKITILGEDGRWGFKDHGGFRFIGWSFSSQWYKGDPMALLDSNLLNFPGPKIGLLHCDLDPIGESSYAGVRSAELESCGVDQWFLGHIHRPSAPGRVLYCGSPYPLDRSEEGFHGIWTMKDAGKPEFVQLAPFVHQTLEVDVTGVKEINPHIVDCCSNRAKALSGESGLPLDKVLFNLTLKGIASSGLELGQESLKELWTDDFRILDFKDATEPALDLKELSLRPGPVGAIASMMLDPPNQLLDEIRSNISSLQKSRFKLPNEPFDEREFLIKAARRLLKAMLAQTEARNG